jgi:hypothetical protein
VFDAIGVTSKCGGKNLDRNCTIKPGVAGAIPLAHPTRAQGREDFVWAEFGTGGYSHEVGRNYSACERRECYPRDLEAITPRCIV